MSEPMTPADRLAPMCSEAIYTALRSYRSNRWRDEDGEPMELLDILGPDEPSVEPAREELRRIAEHIADELPADVRVASPTAPDLRDAPSAQEIEAVARTMYDERPHAGTVSLWCDGPDDEVVHQFREAAEKYLRAARAALQERPTVAPTELGHAD